MILQTLWKYFWHYCIFTLLSSNKKKNTILQIFVFCLRDIIWNKVFKNGPSKICGRQPLKIWRDTVCSFQYFPTSTLGGMCTNWVKSEVLCVFFRWVMIYPVYINNRCTQEEGRKIAKNKVGVPYTSD